ncbi:uncharacterized protein [Fopius arisanus]|uniref:Uncharacterized protein isoform X2 n=1 Tax=Fopius arisanus TaxID=64838 RepID=A0A9R1T4Q2_9HYME|nr:PREDICTED: uncharacterized protein LOC105266368 isoform X2 [Fopius arisanus]
MRKLKKALSHARKGTTTHERIESGIKDTTTFVNYRNHVSRVEKVVTNENPPFVAREEVKSISLKYNRNDPGPSVTMPESLVKNRVKNPSKCQVRKCRGIKARDTEADRLRQLIMKVKELKKNVDEYETIKITQATESCHVQPSVEKSTQTAVDDTQSALIVLHHCQDEMMKLQEFLQDASRHLENPTGACCEIVTPHVHTFVDGLSAVIKYSVDRTPHHELPSTSYEPRNYDAISSDKGNHNLRVCPRTITTAANEPEDNSRSETFVSENTPGFRIIRPRHEEIFQAAIIQKLSSSLVEGENSTDIQLQAKKTWDMDKIIIVVRCSPPRYASQLPMGSKTILTLREPAVFRTSDLTSTSDYTDDTSDDDNSDHETPNHIRKRILNLRNLLYK